MLNTYVDAWSTTTTCYFRTKFCNLTHTHKKKKKGSRGYDYGLIQRLPQSSGFSRQERKSNHWPFAVCWDSHREIKAKGSSLMELNKPTTTPFTPNTRCSNHWFWYVTIADVKDFRIFMQELSERLLENNYSRGSEANLVYTIIFNISNCSRYLNTVILVGIRLNKKFGESRNIFPQVFFLRPS